MHKIDSTAAILDMPMPNLTPAGTPGWFSHDPPNTVVTADWANAVQAEICNVISEAGVTLDKTKQDQLLTAIKSFGRIKLTQSAIPTPPNETPIGLVLHVATTGSDSTGNGTADAPYQTIQQAVNVATAVYDTQGYGIMIEVADGDYSAGAGCSYILGPGQLHIKSKNGPSACRITRSTPGAIFYAVFNCNLIVEGFKLGAPSGSSAIGSIPGTCISASLGGVVTLKNIDFGVTQRAHMETGSGGYMIIAGDYTISGGAEYHIISGVGMLAYGGAAPITVTLTGVPTFAGAFAWSASGFIYCLSGTGTVVGTVRFIGTATGTKYLAIQGGVFTTNGGGASLFPGSLPGDATSGYYT